MSLTDRLPPLAQAMLRESREENISLLAGSLAYNAFVSLVPLLALAFVVLTFISGQTLAAQLRSATSSILTPNTQDVIVGALQNSTAAAGASAVGLVTLLWGSLKIFRGLDVAFDVVYDTRTERSFVEKTKSALIALAALGLAVAAAVAVSVLFAQFGDAVPYLGIINPLLLVVGLVIAFFPLYYLFPDVDHSPRQVLPGVVFAAVGWAALQALFQLYLTFADKRAVYGIIGAVVLVLTWLYFSSLVLLLGAVLNAVLVGRGGTHYGDDDSRAPVDRGESGGSPATAGDGAGEGRRNLRERHRLLEEEHAELRREHAEFESMYERLRSGRDRAPDGDPPADDDR